MFQNGPIFTGKHFEKQGGHAAFSVEMFIETNCALILIKKCDMTVLDNLK